MILASAGGERLNEAAAKQNKNKSSVWVGESGLVYEGPLTDLDWHKHAFACALIARAGSFEIETRSSPRQEVSAVLAPPAVEHKLYFHDAQMLTIYIAPHERLFARLHKQDTPGLCTPAALTELHNALARWDEAADIEALRSWIASVWGGAPSMDYRVRQLLVKLWAGEGLRSSPGELAEPLGLSASRISRLLKRDTGSNLGDLQRGYRFWHAARAMITHRTFTDAAHAAEFADAAHFSRAFRRAYGLAPSKILALETDWLDGTPRDL